MNALLFPRLPVILLLAAFGLTACDSMLEEKPTSFIGPNNFYRNAEDAEAALAGAYNQLTQGTFGGYLGSYQFTILVSKPSAEVMSWGGASAFDTWRWTPARSERGVLATTYEGAYKGINAANAVIENVPEVENMDSALRARYVAEARFLRDLHYYYLVGIFGGVPLVRNETKGLNNLKGPRAPADSVYTFLINDLQTAIPDLPVASEVDVGTAAKGAAKALLAKVYLQRAALNAENGFPGEFQIAQSGDYQNAADWAQEVIDSGEYSLPSDVVAQFTDLFIDETSGGNNPEIIFALRFDPSSGLSSSLPCLVANHDAGQPLVGSSWNQYRSEFPFYTSYEDADLRREGTFLTEYISESSGEQAQFDVDNVKEDNYFGDVPSFHKYSNAAEGTSCDEDNDFVIMRYADVLLMKAEALNEVNQGPTPAAYDAINQVRERAGLDPLSGLDYVSFREAVYTERRKELVTEGHDWHTVQRFFDIATRRVREHAEFDAQFPPAREWGPVLEELEIEDPKDRFFPIPQSAIDRNPALTQNPGY